MAPKTKEKEEDITLNEREEAESLKQGENMSDEELAAIEAEGIRIEQQKAAQKEARDKARQESGANQNGEKMYSQDQVKDMMRDLLIEMDAKRKAEDADGIDADELYKNKKVRLARFKNKFIFGFVNQNDDEFFPELVIHAFDVWSDQEKKNVAWVEVLFEDNTTMKLPLYTVLTKSTKVDCDLLETVTIDKSYSNGKTEVKSEVDADSYNARGTGMYVKLKVNVNEYKFRVKLPSGQEVIVGPEVINW